MIRHVFITLAVLMIAACVTPQTRAPIASREAVEAERRAQEALVRGGNALGYGEMNMAPVSVGEYVAQLRRLDKVSFRIARAGVPECAPQTQPGIGMSVMRGNELGGVHGAELATRLGLVDNAPRIYRLATDAPAARAGLKLGDIVSEVNGQAITSGRDFGRALAALHQNKTFRAGAPLDFTVVRGGRSIRKTLTPDLVCAYAVDLDDNVEPNAFADGKRVVMSIGIMRLLRDDNQVAVIVGHEMVHNAMRHIDAGKLNSLAGGLLGVLIDAAAGTGGEFANAGQQLGARAYSQDFEREADYVGLYLTARAGFDVAPAPMIWRLMASVDPRGIRYAGTHPTHPERYVGLEQTIAEISAKRRAGGPLIPNRKEKQ